MADFELASPKRLGRTVVLGYCDIAAAGIRECPRTFMHAYLMAAI